MNPFKKKPAPTIVEPASEQAVAVSSLETPAGSSLEAPQSAAVTTGAITEQYAPNPFELRARALKRRARIIRYSLLAIFVLSAGTLYFVRLQAPHTDTNLSSSVNQRYGTVTIPLTDIAGGTATSLSSGGTVSVNGQLNVNNALVLSPIDQPTSAVAGQLYYDKTSNQLAFYDGTAFNTLAAGNNVVSSIDGQTGPITLGNGLGFVDDQLSYTGSAGVLSLQGQSGDISLTAGDGIAIDGTTVSSTGVLALGGQNGNIALGAGLSVAGGSLKNSGILSVNAGANITVINDGNGGVTISTSGGGSGTVSSAGGTSGKLAVWNGVQSIADSLVSQSGSVVTVTGDLTVTGNLNLSTPLTVLQGGTGSTTAAGARTNLGAAARGANSDITSLSGLTTALSVAQGGTGVGTLATNGVLLGNGASPITAVSGSNGQCLVVVAGVPTFTTCPGSGSVTGSGTGGTIPLFNGAGTVSDLTNSILTQSGLTVTVAGI